MNGRGDEEGQNEWSIRQTAVYLQLHSSTAKQRLPNRESRSTFLLIAPSKNVETQLAGAIKRSLEDEYYVSPWNIQRLLFADSFKGWPDYMASLEKQLKKQSDRIVIADVGSKKENLSPLDLTINFGDRQDLKIIEDSIIDLDVILPTMLNTIKRIQEQCRKCNERVGDDEKCHIEEFLEEFDEYVREAEILAQRANILKKTARSTAQLISDLLSYEEAVALKDLTKESQAESTLMRELAEKSTKDAAAVKILTVITLIYLPTTIVANFFSTQFVQTNDSGHMTLTSNAWLLAAIAIPLTIFTVMLWWTWLHFFTQVTPAPPSSQPLQRHERQNSFRSFLSFKKTKQPLSDIETGLSSPQTPPFSPASFHDSAIGSWSTTTPSTKLG
ncbi:hypothetical protein LOCC1_G005609 [Lachnellula occidentalis]|uniref:Magnesium transport protein CorA n=1 Tax=Lachnellula occidentalis TaxID=215460 RepID=A0A8H8UDG0_9HELO|nr:hypothetical protein LOCC1_G005609 [Lachnellula occidentalis]